MSAANDSDVGQSAESSTDVGHGLVSCHLCLGLVAPDDLSRHYQCYHPGEASPPSRSSKLIAMVVTDKSGCHESNDAVTPAVPLPHQCSPRVAAAIDRDTIDEAVSANLELHRDYSKEAMVGLLRREFAGVPREYRALFVDIANFGSPIRRGGRRNLQDVPQHRIPGGCREGEESDPLADVLADRPSPIFHRQAHLVRCDVVGVARGVSAVERPDGPPSCGHRSSWSSTICSWIDCASRGGIDLGQLSWSSTTTGD